MNPKIVLPAGLFLLGLLPWSAGALEPSVGDVAHGQRLYFQNCASCHGLDGRGLNLGWAQNPPNLSEGAPTLDKSPEQFLGFVKAGCRGARCSGWMPSFSALRPLELWDLTAYVRAFSPGLRVFFAEAGQVVAKRYLFGEVGRPEFRAGQLERLKREVGVLAPNEQEVLPLALYKGASKTLQLNWVPLEAKALGSLKKEDKLGYVVFLNLKRENHEVTPVGIGLDRDLTIRALRLDGPGRQVNQALEDRLQKYLGLGKRGNKAPFVTGKDKGAQALDKAVMRAYLLAVEATVSYEAEERDRNWADDGF